MPRRAKGPRLYLRTGRSDARSGKPLPDVWVIRDGTIERSTGCAPDCLDDAAKHLSAYLAEKWTPDAGAAIRNRRDPAQVGIDEVLALYAMERAPKLKADPTSTAGFIAHLNAWWAGKMVSDVRRSTCEAYVRHRTAQPIRHGKTGRTVSTQTASRELDTLSAAIGYWHGEDALTTRPKVSLPEKPESPRDALTRSQAAALLKAAMGWQKGETGWKRLSKGSYGNRKHMRRFILIGLYTGSRSKVITSLLREESPAQAWVDLDRGVVFRRGRSEREAANKRRPLVKLSPRLLAHMRRWDRLDRELKETPPTIIHHAGAPVLKVRTGFEGCVRDAGLPEEVTPHWLRHTCATWLMERGADMWEAAGYTGMSAAVLEKHYGHHRPDHQAGAIKAIGGKR